MTHNTKQFSTDELMAYFDKVKPLITKIVKSKQKPYVHEPTIFGDNSEENIKSLETAHNIKQKQMKEGLIAQTIIGNFEGWDDLGRGHSSGLDCCKKDNSIIMDVKNRYNTCNSGSGKALFDKLSKYKKENPDTRCVWGIVNPKPGCKKLRETIVYKGVEIEKIQGVELFKLVYNLDGTDYSDQVIKFVQETMTDMTATIN